LNSLLFALIVAASGFVLLMAWLLFQSRGAIGMLLKARLRGENLHTVTRDADGVIRGACPKCGDAVVYSEVKAGVRAFHCARCGGTGTWTDVA
jgi:ribosomal protein S27AE